MEHYEQLDKLVEDLVQFAKRLDNATKYAAVSYTVLKLLMSNYSVVESLGIVELVKDHLKEEAKELTKSLKSYMV